VEGGAPDAAPDHHQEAGRGENREEKIENRLANDRLLESSYDSLLKRY